MTPTRKPAISAREVHFRGFQKERRQRARYSSSPFLASTVSGLAAWYDFSDVATLWKDTARTSPVTADADVILGVTDKSGGGYHLAEATNGPAYKVGIQNGKSVSRYDGTNDQLAVAATLGFTSNTMFIVCKIVSLTANDGIISITDATPAGNDDDYQAADMHAFHQSPTLTNGRFSTMDNAAGSRAVDMGDFETGFAIASSTLANTDISSNLYRNGAVIETNGASEARVASDGGVLLGARWVNGAASNFGNSDIGEVLLYNSVLSPADHNKVGNYLAAKWGLTWTAVS